MNPMQPSSLYSICYQKTYDVLKTGLFNRYARNPFSFLPSPIISDLTKFALSQSVSERPRTTDLLLLINSGRLTELDLIHHDLETDPNEFFSNISEKVGKNLKSFSLPAFLKDADGPSVEAAFRACTNLEEVHSAVPFDLDVLRNCPQLKILRFHLPLNQFSNNSLSKMTAIANTLKNLEVFAFCTVDDSFSSSKFVAKVLLSFPTLISVGLVDSSLPIKVIEKTTSCMPLRLTLKRCSWGLSHDSYVRVDNTRKLSVYRKRFPTIIQLAALSCPHTEELVINVFHKESLQYLGLLKNLTFLNIDFYYCDHDYTSEWFSLLKNIGPRLKHLSVESSSNISVNAICDSCVNLESLRINGKAVVSESSSTSSNLPHLRHLFLMCMDDRSLMLLLQGSPLLTEIFLDCAISLDDSLLSNILRHNPLSKVKTAGIMACKLSKLGVEMLLGSAISLEKMCFKSVIFDAFDMIHRLNPKIVHFPIYYKLRDREFFRCKLRPCRF